MLILPKYLLCNNAALSGTGLLLCTNPPFYYSSVWLFEKDFQADDFITRHVNSTHTTPFKRIAGYNILIVISGSLSPAPLQNQELQLITDEMADFFFHERMERKPGNYRKFKTE